MELLAHVNNAMQKYIFINIKKFYSTRIIGKIAATVVVILLIALTIWLIPVLQVEHRPIELLEQKPLSQVQEEISIDAGQVLVGESESKKLYINTKNMNLKVVDNKTGREWNSIIPTANQNSEMALISVTYLGEDNNLYEWDSYQYCVAKESYRLYQIDNGVQIQMHFNEGESNRFYEYYPKKMPIERFEKFFMEGLDALVAEGTIDRDKAGKYKQTLNLVYKRSLTEECYAVAYSGTPPLSAVNQLLEVAKLLGYTTEMLIEDCNAFGLTPSFVEPASFHVTVEAILDGDDLVIRIPTYEIVSDNDFYTVQNIKVFPNFGAAAVDQYEEGYILVPDGSGALIDFNSYNPTVPDYMRPVYDNDYYKDYYFMPEFGEELMMPVFGMTYGKDENSTHGFLAIIENGAETSYINVKLASKDSEMGVNYNKVYASFDSTQYSRVKVYGPYSDNAATYLVDSGMMDLDYTIRYKLFPDTTTYFNMAMAYQNYLLEQNPDMILSYPDSTKVYLEVLGTLSLQKRFLGIPYYTTYSMTTYNDLIHIIEDLGNRDMVVHYSGVFNGGLRNRMNNKAELVDINGTEEELQALMTFAEENQIDLFFEVALSRVYEGGNGFYPRLHATRDFSNTPVTMYPYYPSLGILGGAVGVDHFYYILSPYYLSGVVDKFLQASEEYDSLYIPDLANMYYSDYRFRNFMTPYKAMKVLDDSLKKLSQEKRLALYNPLMKNISYGDYAVEISRESSDYATFGATIPFRQLVLNGLIEFTTENVNMSSKSVDYYILQAVELGAYPKFTITRESVDILKDTPYSYYYSTEYDNWKDTIKEVYDECRDARERIGTGKIINHKMIMERVYQTDYEGGVSVITNYNLRPVNVGGYTIEPLGYVITGEQGA